MPQVSDLVTDSQLETTFNGDLTTHLVKIVQANVRRSEIKHEQIWRREKKPLGEGSSGVVWQERLVAGPSTCNERAVKAIRKRLQNKASLSFHQELEAIAKFSHPNYNDCFVQSYGWYEDEATIYISMEYLPCGDLQGYMYSSLVEADVREISSQVLEGLNYMHTNNFAHRDLNPRNILVRSPGPDWWVKIGDFGISKRATEDGTVLRTLTGTPGFIAPEVLISVGLLDGISPEEYGDYSVAVDIWSLGVIVFRSLTKRAPFPYPWYLQAYIKNTIGLPYNELVTQKISTDGCNFVADLLKPKPKDRPTAPAAMNHPWLKSARMNSHSSNKEQYKPSGAFQDNQSRTSGNTSQMSKSQSLGTKTQLAAQDQPWTSQDTGRWTDLNEDEHKRISGSWVQKSSRSGTEASRRRFIMTSKRNQQTLNKGTKKEIDEKLEQHLASEPQDGKLEGRFEKEKDNSTQEEGEVYSQKITDYDAITKAFQKQALRIYSDQKYLHDHGGLSYFPFLRTKPMGFYSTLVPEAIHSHVIGTIYNRLTGWEVTTKCLTSAGYVFLLKDSRDSLWYTFSITLAKVRGLQPKWFLRFVTKGRMILYKRFDVFWEEFKRQFYQAPGISERVPKAIS